MEAPLSVEVHLNSGVVAFGMSITTGASALNAANYWVNRFAAFVGGAVENRAVGGSGLPSMASIANGTAPYSGRTKIGLIDGPLNDVRQDGAACLPSVKPSLDAMVSSLFSGYFRGPAWPSPVVKTGAWANADASYTGRSRFFSQAPMFTTDPSVSIEIPFTGPIVCVHGFASETASLGDWDIEVDGIPWGHTEWSGVAQPGGDKQNVATVVDGLSAGTHVIRLTPRGTAPRWVLDGIQCPIMAAPVSMGTIPNIANWPQYGAIGTWSDAQACNVIIAQVVDEWRVRNYPVALADVANFIEPTRDFTSDGIHPTDRGHLNWCLAYLSSIRIKP
jgi:hypothetical protein